MRLVVPAPRADRLRRHQLRGLLLRFDHRRNNGVLRRHPRGRPDAGGRPHRIAAHRARQLRRRAAATAGLTRIVWDPRTEPLRDGLRDGQQLPHRAAEPLPDDRHCAPVTAPCSGAISSCCSGNDRLLDRVELHGHRPPRALHHRRGGSDHHHRECLAATRTWWRTGPAGCCWPGGRPGHRWPRRCAMPPPAPPSARQFTIAVRDHPYQSFKAFPDGSVAYAAVGRRLEHAIQIAASCPATSRRAWILRDSSRPASGLDLQCLVVRRIGLLGDAVDPKEAGVRPHGQPVDGIRRHDHHARTHFVLGDHLHVREVDTRAVDPSTREDLCRIESQMPSFAKYSELSSRASEIGPFCSPQVIPGEAVQLGLPFGMRHTRPVPE